MRIVLADIKGGDGFISKDTVVGGYGSRLKPFSNTTRLVARTKSGLHGLPSVHLAYAAALATRAGHDVVGSSGELVDGDTAIVVSSVTCSLLFSRPVARSTTTTAPSRLP